MKQNQNQKIVFFIIFYSRPWDFMRDLGESVQEIYSLFVNAFEWNKL